MNEKTEHSYNLKRMLNILVAKPLISSSQAWRPGFLLVITLAGRLTAVFWMTFARLKCGSPVGQMLKKPEGVENVWKGNPGRGVRNFRFSHGLDPESPFAASLCLSLEHSENAIHGTTLNYCM